VDRRGLTGRVRITGYVAGMADFYEWVRLADVGVALRYPSNGETSAALLRLLLHGKPCIVTDIGSFGDYPDGVVNKIPTPERGDEIGEISRALRALAEEPDYRRRLSEAACAYVLQEHAPERCARHYRDFVDAVMGHSRTRAKLLADYAGREMARVTDGDAEAVFAPFGTLFAAVAGNE